MSKKTIIIGIAIGMVILSIPLIYIFKYRKEHSVPKNYVIELTKVYPQARYVGWDVAITPDGFDLVEMNCPAGHDMFQSFNNPIYDIMLKNW